MKDWKAIGGSKDLWSGVIFLIIGLVFVGFSRNYQMGTAMRMGPAYFPTGLGGLLAIIGFALMVRAVFSPKAAVERFAYSKIALVVIANIAFALLMRRMGLAAALILLVMISAYASKRFKWSAALCLAVGLSVGSTIIFVVLLKLPIPIIGTWFGG